MAEGHSAITINIKTAPHEQLDGLMGGNDDGHYHLTGEEYNLMLDLIEDRRDEEESDEDFYKLSQTEYDKLLGIIDAFYPDEDSDEPVIPSGIDSEALNKLIDERVEARIQEYIKHIDCGEINSNSDTDSSSSEDTNTNTDSTP